MPLPDPSPVVPGPAAATPTGPEPTDLTVVTATRMRAPDLTGPAGCGAPVLVATAPGVDLGRHPVPVRAVVLREDLGRPAALNRAVADLADTVEWVLLLDPAARPRPAALAALRAAAAARPRAGLLGVALHTPTGAPLPSSGPLPTRAGALVGRIPAGGPDEGGGADGGGGWVSTACALVHRTAWASVGGFDPRYLGCGPPRPGGGPDPADVDLADRMRRAGWLVAPVPTATVEVAIDPPVGTPVDPPVDTPIDTVSRGGDPLAGRRGDPGILEPASDGWARYGRDRCGAAGGLVLAAAARLRRRRS